MAVKTPVPPRAWQRMLSGRRLDLLDPSPLDIEIEDIAHGLARGDVTCKWLGLGKIGQAGNAAVVGVVAITGRQPFRMPRQAERQRRNGRVLCT